MLDPIIKKLNKEIKYNLNNISIDDYIFGSGGFPESCFSKVNRLQESLDYIEEFSLHQKMYNHFLNQKQLEPEFQRILSENILDLF